MRKPLLILEPYWGMVDERSGKNIYHAFVVSSEMIWVLFMDEDDVLWDGDDVGSEESSSRRGCGWYTIGGVPHGSMYTSIDYL